MVSLGEEDLWPMTMVEVSYRKTTLEYVTMNKAPKSSMKSVALISEFSPWLSIVCKYPASKFCPEERFLLGSMTTCAALCK